MQCSCSCGATRFATLGEPLFRILCHCTICQRYHNAPFADILVHRAADVILPPGGTVELGAQKPPPNVQRGKCATCGQPAIAVIAVPFLPRLVTVFSSMFTPDTQLPPPVAHIFYDKRVTDIEDPYPKHEGFLRSEIAFLRYLRSAGRA